MTNQEKPCREHKVGKCATEGRFYRTMGNEILERTSAILIRGENVIAVKYMFRK